MKKESEDIDPQETKEWLDALESTLENEGIDRTHFILENLIAKARKSGVYLPFLSNTAYLNTIPPHQEIRSPGDPAIEWRIRSFVRWNAMVMVLRANRKSGDLGGHISSFASSATLYDVGFNHFFHAPSKDHKGDLVFVQGHSAPGIYARAFLTGRVTAEQMDNFRQEVDGKGLSSYPHPWLMPDYWQFPTVSMGLGPIMAIYQARFMHYLENRGLAKPSNRKVWAFVGDGETDEPETMGAISLASREKLDNLIFVINCNLQRLDGPVRGNGKIIQELESAFRGAGWNVIKVIWGSSWDPLIAKDKDGLLYKRMEEAVDGEYQAYKANDGAYVREKFFGKYPDLKAMVSSMTDQDIWRLNRGGHDPHKVYAAYAAAVKKTGQPTVILAKTVKGYGMGEAGEAQNISHQQKKMNEKTLKKFRDRFNIPIPDEEIADIPYYIPPADSEEIKYLKKQRKALGGYFFTKKSITPPLEIPDLSIQAKLLEGTGERNISTTMAFVRILNTLLKDKKIAQNIVPIVPDEARTFGMEGMFRQLGIYSSEGQLYEPVDHDQVMYYREDIKGQILEEGLNEAGAYSSWIAAATAYKNHGIHMIPFYIYYSMFGFQRIGDLAWAGGDMRSRGFLLGGTAGRTTLNGEGLQHQDGHSHVLASTIPNCIAYDPTYAYELAVIIHDGLKRMYKNVEDVFYYITVMNENYQHPPMPKNCEEGIIKGMYLLQKTAKKKNTLQVQLLGSGTILREVIAAAELLQKNHSVNANIWSVTSFNELRREGLSVQRWNMLHPEQKPKTCYVTDALQQENCPTIAATDYMKIHADQIRDYIPGNYTVLGTDGYGRSDTREKLRHFFEVDRFYITIAALKSLADIKLIDPKKVSEAIKKYKINTEKPNPSTV